MAATIRNIIAGWRTGSDRERVLQVVQPGLIGLIDGTLSTHADLSEFAGGPLNDMVVDSAGHAYVGNFGFDLMTGGKPGPTPRWGHDGLIR